MSKSHFSGIHTRIGADNNRISCLSSLELNMGYDRALQSHSCCTTSRWLVSPDTRVRITMESIAWIYYRAVWKYDSSVHGKLPMVSLAPWCAFHQVRLWCMVPPAITVVHHHHGVWCTTSPVQTMTHLFLLFFTGLSGVRRLTWRTRSKNII